MELEESDIAALMKAAGRSALPEWTESAPYRRRRATTEAAEGDGAVLVMQGGELRASGSIQEQEPGCAQSRQRCPA